MKYKSNSLQSEFNSRPRKLREIAETFDMLSSQLGVNAVLTRVLEKIDGSSGVHEAGRAVDFRDETRDQDSSFLYTKDQSNTLVEELNKLYPREDNKKVCIHHSFNNGPYHFHIQIPVSWIEKGEKC